MNAQHKSFDVVVLGAGPGGYPAAIRAAQGGASVALIEAKELGGTCLNRGCIPTKTLLANADVLKQCLRAADFGIKTGKVSFDYAQMKQRKDDVVSDVRTGLTGLLKSNKIEVIRGYGKFTSPNEIKVIGEDSCFIEAKKVIIATGSEPFELPSIPFDHERIFSSTSLLELTKVPKKIIIVGGGYIGCEFASLFRDLGSEVVILEALPSIVSMGCASVSRALQEAFEEKGIEILCNTLAKSIVHQGKGVRASLANGDTIDADCALIATGRSFNSDKIGLEAAGISTGDKGEILVNEHMETDVPGIYAIGDVTGIAMLAHVATHQGLTAAQHALGLDAHIDYRAIPAVIFTNPEIALVGYSLEQAIENGHDATVGQFPFSVLGKAKASLHAEGFAQIVTDKRTGQVLGAQVVGHEAANLIAEMALVIHNELTIESVVETIHAHPTMAEAWLEAALIANETPVHMPPKRRRQPTTKVS